MSMLSVSNLNYIIIALTYRKSNIQTMLCQGNEFIMKKKDKYYEEMKTIDSILIKLNSDFIKLV